MCRKDRCRGLFDARPQDRPSRNPGRFRKPESASSPPSSRGARHRRLERGAGQARGKQLLPWRQRSRLARQFRLPGAAVSFLKLWKGSSTTGRRARTARRRRHGTTGRGATAAAFAISCDGSKRKEQKNMASSTEIGVAIEAPADSMPPPRGITIRTRHSTAT